MAINRSGTTALDRLGKHFDDVDLVCPDCGYEDREGGWQAATAGLRIHYRHVCPSCGSIRTRELRLDRKT